MNYFPSIDFPESHENETSYSTNTLYPFSFYKLECAENWNFPICQKRISNSSSLRINDWYYGSTQLSLSRNFMVREKFALYKLLGVIVKVLFWQGPRMAGMVTYLILDEKLMSLLCECRVFSCLCVSICIIEENSGGRSLSRETSFCLMDSRVK